MVAAVALLAVRNWIILGHPIPIGPLGDPVVLLANKLQGWFHLGNVQGTWSWTSWSAGLLWEWLPGILFALGISRVWGAWIPKLSVEPTKSVHGPYLPAAFLFAISLWISWAAFEGIPHVQDSIAQQFQAQVFASGRIWAPVPPEGWLLRSEFMVQHDGRWFAQYPPGHAALLALGSIAGCPWLVGPLIAAASAVLVHSLAVRVYGNRTAFWAVWLFSLSPLVWFMSGERMNHTTTLFWVLVALRFLAPALCKRWALPARGALLGAGLALGLAVSTRPLCGTVWVLIALGCLLGARKAEGGTSKFMVFLVTGSGIAAGISPMLAFNAATTGSPWVTGYELQWGSTGWGFGQSQWGNPHTLGAGLAAAWSNWDALGKYLLEWPVPATVLLLGCLFLPRWRPADRILISSLAGLTIAYLPYFFQDLCLGPRFLYAGLPAVALLSARGALVLAVWVGERYGLGKRNAIRLLPAYLGLLTLTGFVTQFPALWKWYSNGFWGAGTELVRQVEQQGLENSVVFIRDRSRLRCELLRRQGVPLAIAKAAVDALDPQWIDAQMAHTRRNPSSSAQLGSGFRAALADPNREHRRTTAPWIESAGPSSNVSLGFWANTPQPASQKVIYALHPGNDNLAAVLPAFPGRRFWVYDVDPSTRRFALIPVEVDSPQLTTDH